MNHHQPCQGNAGTAQSCEDGESKSKKVPEQLVDATKHWVNFTDQVSRTWIWAWCVCVLAAPVTYFRSHDMTNALRCFGAPWLQPHQDESTGLAVGAGPQWATVVQHGANANVKATCLHTCAGKRCVQ